MASYDKIVKLACKPKAAAPKAKYLDPIIAATYQEDGAVSDVCRALAPRIREPNAVVVFKALIVLHTMIRNGSTDNVLGYLAKFDILRLSNVANGHWEGYRAPENMARYAAYMESRVKAYRDLKHDAIRVQTESNRDHRVSVMEEDRPYHSGLQRSKTVAGRKLRVMTVDKGLLRETKIVQNMIDALVETKFYLDDLEGELNIIALRMLVKDLLILFQAGNEGVINLLEHYFEMSHIDAETALSLYRRFCRQTEKVVEYLSVAKKLQNLLNVSIPNLKHAPVSLVGALEEYLRDPNFEQNRLEYRANKAAADGKTPAQKEATPPPIPSAPASAPVASSSSTKPPSAPPPAPRKVEDFFTSIEQEQSHMFNPTTNSPTGNYFQQQAAFNPFMQKQVPHATGAFPSGAGPFIQSQSTGFLPLQGQQMPGFGQSNPFGAGPLSQMTGFQNPQSPQPQMQIQQQQTSFIQPRPQSSFLQSQVTGSNPFRQSMIIPQSTGLPTFGGGPSGPISNSTNPFPRAGSAMALSNPQATTPFSSQATSAFGGGPVLASNTGFNAFGIVRPASTPVRSNGTEQSSKTVVSHRTGSRNPFGQPLPPPVPPLPKAPTLQELASGSGFASFSSSFTPSRTQPASQSQPSTSGDIQSHQTGGGGLISSIASSFAAGTPPAATSPSGATGQINAASPTSIPSANNWASSLSSQQTSSTAWSSGFSTSTFSASDPSSAPTSPPPSVAPLRMQPTGFGGSSVRPFKPSSSFGAALFEKLPPIPSGSEPSTPQPQTNGSIQPSNTLQPMGTVNAPSAGLDFGSSSSNTFGGSGLGGGLRAQQTGTANPFRLSMAAGSTLGGPPFASSMIPNSSNFGGNGSGASQFQQPPVSGFNAFSSPFGSGPSGQSKVQG